MRAYYANRLSGLSRIVGVFFVAASTSTAPTLKAQAPAQDRPSAVIGTIDYCPKTLWRNKQIHGCTKIQATQPDLALANAALEIVNKLVKSDEFKAAVLSTDFDPRQMKTCRKNVCGAQLTKDQIYGLIVSSAPQKINVTYYLHHKPDRGNQGFEDSGALDTVFANDEKVNGDSGFLASLMLHEWMHILGFQHAKRYPACKSVPYEMNVIYAKVAPQLNLPPSETGCTDKQ